MPRRTRGRKKEKRMSCFYARHNIIITVQLLHCRKKYESSSRKN